MTVPPPTPTSGRKGGHQGTDLTTGSIPRHLIAFSIPMLIGSALQTAYNIINAMWVGNGLGTEAMAAITVSFPVHFMLMAIAGGLTIATTILVSQAYGAKNYKEVDRAIDNSVILALFISVACLVTGHFGAEWVLRMMDTPPSILALSVNYFRLFIWTVPFMFGMLLISAILRGVGDSKTPLYFQAISVAFTGILDPILMFGWLGFPKMGLNGTAAATIFSQAVALIVLLHYLHRKKHIASLVDHIFSITVLQLPVYLLNRGKKAVSCIFAAFAIITAQLRVIQQYPAWIAHT
jgi:putative MATE family efflux protein